MSNNKSEVKILEKTYLNWCEKVDISYKKELEEKRKLNSGDDEQ